MRAGQRVARLPARQGSSPQNNPAASESSPAAPPAVRLDAFAKSPRLFVSLTALGERPTFLYLRADAIDGLLGKIC